MFYDLMDEWGEIQLMAGKDVRKNFNTGDIIGAKGIVTKSVMERRIECKNL